MACAPRDNESADAESAIRTLVEATDAYLAGLSGEGVADVRARIDAFRSGAFRPQPALPLAFQADLDRALALLAADGQGGFAATIGAASPFLRWVPYDRYPRADIGERFAASHAFASFMGEDAPVAAREFDLGLFLIRPRVFYRDHHHAAPELYAPLTGPHGWRFAPGAALDWRPAHSPVWNPPFRHHATMTGANPFLCVFAWTADVGEPASVIACADWAELGRQAEEAAA